MLENVIEKRLYIRSHSKGLIATLSSSQGKASDHVYSPRKACPRVKLLRKKGKLSAHT